MSKDSWKRQKNKENKSYGFEPGASALYEPHLPASPLRIKTPHSLRNKELGLDFKMFSFVMKFGNRPHAVFNIVCLKWCGGG